jgi:NAD(P)-dependent dehydrogenase (short-subunit alcohol dehydrogenase family)
MVEPSSVRDRFDLTGRVAVITGGAGLLGVRHAEAVIEMGGLPVLVDLNAEQVRARASELTAKYAASVLGIEADITQRPALESVLSSVLSAFGKVDILINNAANNPKIEAAGTAPHWTCFETFSLDAWSRDLAVSLTGAFLCSQVIGSQMARQGNGVILNIASDLGVIAPDQRIYKEPGLAAEQQPVKPVSYSVVKHGLIGLTRYLATYWADRGVRANALSPGGVYANQGEPFVKRLTNLIPMGRMARDDEYKAAVVFLVSDASSYMTGANVIVDGGRTVW